ncbi:phosphate transport system permease protein [Natronospira proteinivora]|uniref:Phosphate transport system permease protein PstA n=1 Tax=Natronospira proteinivora TaxID=1807133 RepID=A0ABT1G5G4_9GAMM|nr:phosphate ABC transporter permease PstA [Natronospira proteinivora]MCP1726542.1 phosphate transport system permease protein [Natronospira proteinivora]
MNNWFKSGTPWIWLNAGAVAISMVMVIGLIGLIAVRGLGHFWPSPIVEISYTDEMGEEKRLLGEIRQSETLTAAAMRETGLEVPEEQELVTRHLLKQGNRDIFTRDFQWYLDDNMGEWDYPAEAVMLERQEWGDFYGYLREVREGGITVATGKGALDTLQELAADSAALMAEVAQMDRYDIGAINRQIEQLRLERRRVDMNDRLSDEEKQARFDDIQSQREALEDEYEELRSLRNEKRQQAANASAIFEVMDGRMVEINFSNLVRATTPNVMSAREKFAEYFSRFWSFLSDYPREANTEGGIFPAIFGTVTMVIIMSIFVTPFGVLAAIYLREYAKQGPLTRAIRISVNNLAGVPSIVFGVFGLGFFVYFIGGNIDQIFYPESLPSPTFGTPGLIWVSLTLALLTLPVVIVSTEEGLSRIPKTVREGSLALGATKAETLWRTVVPLASPAMMTGLILAVARAAGEVAPLMLVGVVKLAPNLPVDGQFPYVHLERSIMHLGFHIYDVGFQSPNVEAARPLVYATSLVLVTIIIILNLTAIGIRNHLREKYKSESD